MVDSDKFISYNDVFFIYCNDFKKLYYLLIMIIKTSRSSIFVFSYFDIWKRKHQFLNIFKYVLYYTGIT